MKLTSSTIEKSKFSFQPGRRQNDVVNWTLVKMIENPGCSIEDLTRMWDEFYLDRSKAKVVESLLAWDEEPEHRIEIVHGTYAQEDPIDLSAYIIDMEY